MTIRFGMFTLDEERRQLTKDGEPLPLSPKAFQLLRMLVAQRPRVVSKEKIIEALWPDVAVEEANVRNLIAEVRDAVGADLIRTAHRLGYAFEGAVHAGPRIAARLEDTLRAYPLVDGASVIGRDPSCAVALDARGVSREHARIRFSAGTARLEDLGSKNGTWVNGARIDCPVVLREGDKVAIGTLTLTYRLQDAAGTTSSLDLQLPPRPDVC
ncbi:MAG TPA: FHA domain-containing protein [Thermoanaerobaculia bacterium]|nr:FHA domain-containing protein [Thermoanaerobaculia bacterium]